MDGLRGAVEKYNEHYFPDSIETLRSYMKKIGIVGKRSDFHNGNYYDAVESCGAQTQVLDLYGGTESVRELDGIILPGGTDVNPALYHEGNTDSRELNKRLDWFELAVLSEAVKYRIPVLGICRGHQIINVFFGGSLIQNVDHCETHDYHKDRTDNVHGSRIEPGTFLHEIFGTDRISINSAHHQAVHRLGEGLAAAQYSDDGLIEAIWHERLPVFGVQWHPERMCLKNARSDTADGLTVFRFFVDRVAGSSLWEGFGQSKKDLIEYYI